MTQEPPPPSNSPNPPPDRPDDPLANTDPGYGPPSLQDLQAEYLGLGKRVLIGLLRAIVRLLESWISALEAPPRAAQPTLSASPPGELTADSSALARTEPDALPVPIAPSLGSRLRTAVQQLWGTVQPAAQQVWAAVKPYWDKGWDWWTANALPKIRAVLPASIREALTDRVLSGAIAGIAALLIFVVPNLLPSQEPTRITEPPLISEAPADGRRVEQPLPRVTTIPEAVPDDLPPAPTPSPGDTPRPSRPAAKPQPLPTPQPSPLPTPTVPARPTLPDQPLVAAIQEQITSVTDAYSENLIQTIQASFRSGRLRVNLGEGWYALSPVSQDKLAADLLRRSTKLDFTKLELVAPDGTLLARSPVVGDRMIILKRSLQPEQAA
ncbi:MAG: hypothetical protein OHK0037_37970 [Elainellaceae cyanobacterium]